jgi:hypothetical protein
MLNSAMLIVTDHDTCGKGLQLQSVGWYLAAYSSLTPRARILTQIQTALEVMISSITKYLLNFSDASAMLIETDNVFLCFPHSQPLLCDKDYNAVESETPTIYHLLSTTYHLPPTT